jgi:hypothetical protein
VASRRRRRRPAGSASAPTATATVDAAAAAPPAAKPDKPDKPAVKPTKISKATRAEYKRRLQAGRTLAKATKWPEAIAELEAALALLPGDDRALAELSFAYMASGDLAKARTGRARGGRRHDRSQAQGGGALQPRPRRGDRGARSRGGAVPRVAGAPPQRHRREAPGWAGHGRRRAGPRALAVRRAGRHRRRGLRVLCRPPRPRTSTRTGRTPECKLSATTVDGFQTAEYEMSAIGEASVVLIGRGPAGWAVIADLAYVYNPGAFGISEEFTVDQHPRRGPRRQAHRPRRDEQGAPGLRHGRRRGRDRVDPGPGRVPRPGRAPRPRAPSTSTSPTATAAIASASPRATTSPTSPISRPAACPSSSSASST